MGAEQTILAQTAPGRGTGQAWRALTATAAALGLTALPALAQEDPPVRLSCTMSLLCIEASTCSDWSQEVRITEGQDDLWQVDFDDTLPSDFTLAADLPAPAGSLEPTDVTSLIRIDADTQAVQLVSFSESGEVVITLHQPHLRPRSVTGYGLCSERGEDPAQ